MAILKLYSVSKRMFSCYKYRYVTTVLSSQGIDGVPGMKVSWSSEVLTSALYSKNLTNNTSRTDLLVWSDTAVLPNHLFLLCLPQGDPGGVIGIVPLKGDRGFPGAPGLPVRCVYSCVCVVGDMRGERLSLLLTCYPFSPSSSNVDYLSLVWVTYRIFSPYMSVKI